MMGSSRVCAVEWKMVPYLLGKRKWPRVVDTSHWALSQETTEPTPSGNRLAQLDLVVVFVVVVMVACLLEVTPVERISK